MITRRTLLKAAAALIPASMLLPRLRGEAIMVDERVYTVLHTSEGRVGKMTDNDLMLTFEPTQACEVTSVDVYYAEGKFFDWEFPEVLPMCVGDTLKLDVRQSVSTHRAFTLPVQDTLKLETLCTH